MTSSELAYIAGLWDGEGCFCIGLSPKKNRRKSPYWFAVASICMTDKSALRLLRKHFGGTINCYSRKGVSKDVYEWKLWSRKAAAFAHKILPYLRIKTKVANILFRFQWYINTMNRHYGGGKLLTKADMLKRERFRQAIKKENHRGKI